MGGDICWRYWCRSGLCLSHHKLTRSDREESRKQKNQDFQSVKVVASILLNTLINQTQALESCRLHIYDQLWWQHVGILCNIYDHYEQNWIINTKKKNRKCIGACHKSNFDWLVALEFTTCRRIPGLGEMSIKLETTLATDN